MADDPQPPFAFAPGRERGGTDDGGLWPRTATPALRPPRRRLPGRAALGVALVVGGALAFGLISVQLGGSRAVLAAARDVSAGHVFQASDLRVLNIGSAEGLSPIASSDQDSVLGRPARVDVVSGALLTPGDIGPPPVVGSGQAILAVSLKAGQYPPSLAPGERVQVIDPGTPPSGGSPAPLPSSGVDATVTAVDPDPSPGAGGGAVVSLRLSQGDVPRLTAAAAANRLLLVLVPAAG